MGIWCNFSLWRYLQRGISYTPFKQHKTYSRTGEPQLTYRHPVTLVNFFNKQKKIKKHTFLIHKLHGIFSQKVFNCIKRHFLSLSLFQLTICTNTMQMLFCCLLQVLEVTNSNISHSCQQSGVFTFLKEITLFKLIFLHIPLYCMRG